MKSPSFRLRGACARGAIWNFRYKNLVFGL